MSSKGTTASKGIPGLLLWCNESRTALMAGARSVSNPGPLDVQERLLAYAFQHARDTVTDVYIGDMLDVKRPLDWPNICTRAFLGLQALARAAAMLQYYTPRDASIFGIRSWVSRELHCAEQLAHAGHPLRGLRLALKIVGLAPVCERHLAAMLPHLESAAKYVAKHRPRKKINST